MRQKLANLTQKCSNSSVFSFVSVFIALKGHSFKILFAFTPDGANVTFRP